MTCQLLLVALLFAFSPGQPLEKNRANPVAETDILYRSTDLGLSWEPVNAGLPKDVRVRDLEVQENNLFLATENYGIYTGNTLTAKWWPAGYLMFGPNENIKGLYKEGPDLYANCYDGGLFKSADTKNIWMPWTPLHTNLEDKTIRTVLKWQNKLYVGVDSGIFSTSDQGKTWKRVFDEGQVNSLVEQNGVLFGGTYRGLIRSLDHGATWEWVLEKGMIQKTTVIKDRIVALGPSGEIWASRDSGHHWQRMDEGLPQFEPVYDLVEAQGVLICSHKQGVYRSSDWGTTWELAYESPDKNMFFTLTVADTAIYFCKNIGC